MLLLQALRNRVVSRLWLGQIGSAIGDEIYRMAFIWLAVSYIGGDTGYLAALQLAAVLGFGVFGGKWADKWSPYKTMIGVDLVRAFITFTPVILYYFHINSFAWLVISTICLSGLGAFFEPAMQTVLPTATKDAQELKAANGLMSTTNRFARVAGPALVGILSVFIATIHFFTLNMFSYFFSCFCVRSIRDKIPQESMQDQSHSHVLGSFVDSLNLAKSKEDVKHAFIAKSIFGGVWTLVYGLGMALLAHELSPNNLKAFGALMGTYGLGNVLSALWLANWKRQNSERFFYRGIVVMGFGYASVGLANTFPLLLAATFFTGAGGPVNDIAFTDLMQQRFRVKDLAKVFRLRMIAENFSSLILMSMSPIIFKVFGIRPVILTCGIASVGMGMSGLLYLRNRKPIAA